MNMIDEPKKAPADPCDPNEHPHKEDLLDAAIEDSMDASDPPAIVSKGSPTAPPRRPKSDDASGKTDNGGAKHGHQSGETDRG